MAKDWQQLLNVNPARRDHLPAGRVALGVGAPLLVLLALGRLDLSIYATFAAFTGIYARHEPLPSRSMHQVAAALVLLVCEGLGLLLAHGHAPQDWVVLVGALVAGVGAVLAAVLRLRPAGSLFFVFTVTGIAAIARPASYAQGLGVAGLTALFCVLLGLAGAWWSGRNRPQELAPPPPHGLSRAELGWHGLRHFVAALLAGVLGRYSHFGHSYWAMVAALAPIAAPNTPARVQRAIHRIVGTLGGIGITVFLLAFKPPAWGVALLVIAMQFLAEVFVTRNYSLALLFVTPLALLMSQLAHPSDPWELVTSRAVETVIGALVGLGVVTLLRSAAERRQDAQVE